MRSLACESLAAIMLRLAARVAQRRCMSHRPRPPNWKALAPPLPNFVHQPATLPSLPVPPLPATLQRLRDSLRPLARSTQEFASVCHKIDDFARHDGPGPVLQQLLLQRKNEREHWLEEWWDDSAYLAYRDSVSSCFSASFSLLVPSSRLLSMCHITVSTSSPSLVLLLIPSRLQMVSTLSLHIFPRHLPLVLPASLAVPCCSGKTFVQVN